MMWKAFKVHIKEELNGFQKGRTLSLWCFNSALALRDLLKSSTVRSVILASGTLRPLDSFAFEMGMYVMFSNYILIIDRFRLDSKTRMLLIRNNYLLVLSRKVLLEAR
jgi:Rad3-related DNA helicase